MSTATAVMTTQQIADRLVTLCRKGNFKEAMKELYAPDIVSIEPEGGPGPSRTEGLEAALKTYERFESGTEEVHGSRISNPVVAENFAAVGMYMDITMTGAGRVQMDELAVYEVREGKIVRVQFFYTPMPMPGKN